MGGQSTALRARARLGLRAVAALACAPCAASAAAHGPACSLSLVMRKARVRHLARHALDLPMVRSDAGVEQVGALQRQRRQHLSRAVGARLAGRAVQGVAHAVGSAPIEGVRKVGWRAGQWTQACGACVAQRARLPQLAVCATTAALQLAARSSQLAAGLGCARARTATATQPCAGALE